MTSTYLGYSLVNRDMKTSLTRVANQTTVKREVDYYNANIGKVKSVDDLLKDQRLYTYVMTAYGLEDMSYAKAFMKKVLESDMSDSSSFANRLSDQRYKDLANAFNFGTPNVDVQTDAQEDDLIGLYNQSFADEETQAKKESSYYSSKIDQITSVGDLVNDDRLRNYVLGAYGIDGTYISKSYLKQVLTSDLSDPGSFVNQNASAAFKKLAAQFSFNADGTLANATAQTADQKSAVIEQYNVTVPSFTTTKAAQYNKAYYEANIGNVTKVSDITSDPRLFSYVKAAFSMDPNLSAAAFDATMTSNPDDPGSFANVLGYGWVVKKFNFDSSGNVPSGEEVQTSDLITETSKNYMARYDDAHETLVKDATDNFKKRMESGNIKTIKDFFVSNKDDKDPYNNKSAELYQVALRAYGIDESEVDKAKLTKILESDPYDSKSYVNSLKDDRFVKLAKSLNFDSSGNAAAPVQALDTSEVNIIGLAYNKRMLLSYGGKATDSQKKAIKEDLKYLEGNISKITSVTDFLNDKKMMTIVLTGKGLDPKKYTKDVLKQAFAADPASASSMLNKPENAALKEMVLSFNFDKSGKVTRETGNAVQTSNGLRRLNEAYLEQNLETQQGEANDGVRLALYFQRKAANITSVYDIMGDKALYQVIQTTYNLPSQMSNQNVDKQASLLKRFVNISDLQDPKKVTKLLQRFTALYDIHNKLNDASSSATALTLLTGGG